MDVRKAKAADDAGPFRATAHLKGREAEALTDRLATAKKAKARDEAEIAAAEAELSALQKQSRDAANKAEQIENAVFDLKAVNPNRKAKTDTRTPNELLDLIEAKGREVAAAISALRTLR